MKSELKKKPRKALYQKFKYKEYLRYLDEECKTNADELIRETPMLLAIYEDFVQQLVRESKISKMASESQSKIADELKNILTHDEQKLLLKWQECEATIYDEREQQIFVYGYVISSLLRMESRKKYKSNKHKGKRRGIYNAGG